MLEKLANVFRIPDLRKRILFTLGLLAVYRLGGHIPTPGVNADKLQQFFEQNKGTFLGFVDLFSGGQLRRLTIFALGIMPYITASIMLQLLTVVYEPLAKLQKEGELGRKKITQWTRYITVILSSVQSFGIAMGLEKGGFALNPGWGFRLMTMLTLTTGSAFIMWLGEQITERGVGNGMSLLIFSGIVVGLPRGVVDLIEKAKNAAWGAATFPLMVFLLVFMVAVVAFIVYVERSERRIPVDGMGRATLYSPLCGRHHFLRLLLRFHCFQPQRSCRQHAQVRRIYPGHPAREAYGGLHQRSADANHPGGRAVPDHHFIYSGVDDHRYPPQPSLRTDRKAVRGAPELGDEWSGCDFLLWRYLAVDRGV